MKGIKKPIYILTDFLTIEAAFIVWGQIRLFMGWSSQATLSGTIQLSLFIYLFWLGLFTFFGHYKTWYTRSRTDEVLKTFKTVTIGMVIIFLMTVDISQDLSRPITSSRAMIATYWLLMMGFVGFGRVFTETIRRRLLIKGIGVRNAIIIGCGDKARELHQRIVDAPALGYRILGYVAPNLPESLDVSSKTAFLGEVADLGILIDRHKIQEVLIGLTNRSESILEGIITQCEGHAVGIKITPDHYDIIVGQARINQLYGFPLIEILPELMPTWEHIIKRVSDIIFSLVILLLFLPFGILTALAIKLDSKGPVFYNQRRVGRNGKIYTMMKFRSMRQDAEKMTGPVWATWDDPRVTKFGRFMRRTRLDEFPQLINVIKGDMSWVGPRPERPHFVEQFKEKIPLYARRLHIRPGITGWAQIKGNYDQSIDDVKQKLNFDLFYLENMSLSLDLKIILNTLYVMLSSRGH
ncbi:sugar transferase [bacterium]|nr:sugar transferase [bacterium]